MLRHLLTFSEFGKVSTSYIEHGHEDSDNNNDFMQCTCNEYKM